MKTGITTLLLTTALWVVIPVAASAQTPDPVKAAAELNAKGDPDRAYALLLPFVDTRAGEPEFDYILGLVAADSGHPAEAILAFQRVLSLEPGNLQARAELARAYALGGDIDTAKSQFNTVVQDPSLPDPVRQRFDGIVRNYDREISGGGSDVSGFLDLSGGYDDNVNAATDLTQITIPLFAAFGPGALGAGARQTGDEYYEISGGVSAVAATSRQNRVFGSLLGNWRDNFDSSTYDQAAITATAGAARTLNSRDVVSASVQLQQFWLDQTAYRTSYGGIVQYTKRLGNGRALSLSGEYFQLDYDTDPLRDSNRYSLGLSYAASQSVISASFGHEETRNNAADHLSFNFARLNAGFEKTLGQRAALVGGVSAQLQKYDAADPLFLEDRKDENIGASLGLKYMVSDQIYIRPRVSYTRNWSNIALYDYDRATASIGIRREF